MSNTHRTLTATCPAELRAYSCSTTAVPDRQDAGPEQRVTPTTIQTTKVDLYTSTQIAEVLDVDLSRVRWILTSRHRIRPTCRVGITRLYAASAIEQVRHELENSRPRRDRRAGVVL